MIDLNPSIQKDKEYILDKEYNNTSVVKVIWVGRIYAHVTDGINNWGVVKDRLSEIIKN